MDTSNVKRKYPDDPAREVFEAVKSGDADLLKEVLQELNSSERASALQTEMEDASLCYCVTEDEKFIVTPLILAVKNGNVDCVKILLNFEADIECRGDDKDECDGIAADRKYSYGGCTPLFVAATYGHLDVLSCLVENGADVNACTNDNCSPLMIASTYGHVNAVTFLIKHGTNMDLIHKTGQKALHYAVCHNNDCLDVLGCLIKNGADVNAHDNDNNTPLMIASHNHNVDLVTFLIEHGANMDLQDKKGKTALHHAVGSCDILSCLIRNGADVNACTNHNCTPLMIASKNGLVNVVIFLIEHGANIDLQDKEGKTALHYAVHSCDVLSCLIRNGADVDTCTNGNCTPLMIASKKGLMNVVIFLIEHGANIDLQDKEGKTALHHAVHSCDVLSCLIRNGADVDAGTNDNCTPLMMASKRGLVNVATVLIENGAKVNLQDKNGETALHYAVDSKIHVCDILSCLIRKGADVNVCPNNNSTPLMKASLRGDTNVVAFLVECGANMDQQDKNGNTALHFAVCTCCGWFWPSEVAYKLLSLGASQLYNNNGLTPLLFASNKCLIPVVENLITRPECTKEQRIDALELLGASLATSKFGCHEVIGQGFEYMKRGMKERFADPSHSLLKQAMEPVEAYQNRKESQTLEELARIEGEIDIIIEGLIIRERILGTNNAELLDPIRMVALDHGTVSTELYRHAMKIAQSCNQPSIGDLFKLTRFLYNNVWRSDPPRQNDILELLEQTVLEYEKQQKSRRGLHEPVSLLQREQLFDSAMKLVQTIAKFEPCEEGKSSCLSVLLKRLCCLNPQDKFGGTLLHSAVDEYIAFQDEIEELLPMAVEQDMNDVFLCLDTVKLLLNEGFNVNAVNNNGDTPLHIAVTFVPNNDELHVLTDMLEVLLDGGAHHDFVNNDGKTAIDMAATDEVRMFLSEKRKLELKCISARAVKTFGLPYLGVVPRILEKYISMH